MFHQSGEPFEFEQVERYSARLKRDRLTAEMLADYLGHFGLPAPGDELAGSAIDEPAVLLVRPNTTSLREYTIEEVQEGVPWQK